MTLPVCDHAGCTRPVHIPYEVEAEPVTCWTRVSEVQLPVQGWQAGFFFEGERATRTLCIYHCYMAQAMKKSCKITHLFEASIRAQMDAHLYDEAMGGTLPMGSQSWWRAKGIYEKWTGRVWSEKIPGVPSSKPEEYGVPHL